MNFVFITPTIAKPVLTFLGETDVFVICWTTKSYENTRFAAVSAAVLQRYCSVAAAILQKIGLNACQGEFFKKMQLFL